MTNTVVTLGVDRKKAEKEMMEAMELPTKLVNVRILLMNSRKLKLNIILI